MFRWTSFQGYDIIKVANFRPERFINRIITEGISVHNIRRMNRYAATMTVSHRDLPKALALSKEDGCEIEILHRGGLQLIAGFLRARLALAVGLALAAAALIFLSHRLIAVRTEGCDANLTAEVFETIEGLGVRRGCRLSDIDTALITSHLKQLDPRMTLVSASVNGVVLNVSVSLGEEDRHEANNPPCSIYADKDCVILRAAALDGKLCVQPGDAVKKGQLLVDGDVTPEGAETPTHVHSEAEILGEAAYRFSITVEPTAKKPKRSGNSRAYARLSLFGLRCDSKTGFERYDADPLYGSMLTAFPLPIEASCGTAWEIVIAEEQLSKDEMIAEALKRADIALVTGIPSDARLISKTTDLVWNYDGSLTLAVNVHTIENIGSQRYL